MLERLIGEDVCLKVEVSTGSSHVEADPGQIDQIIMNLAVNARLYRTRGFSSSAVAGSAGAPQAWPRRLTCPAGRWNGSMYLRFRGTLLGWRDRT